MEEKEIPAETTVPEGEKEKGKEPDLNLLYPGREFDLNRLFPDEGTKKLLHDLKRNKRDIDRFVKSLQMEEASGKDNA
jgi:hypothetical protein